MKRVHIITLSLLLISLFHTNIVGHVSGRNYLNNNEPYIKRFDATNIKELKLCNKHGYIDLTSWDKNEIVIEVIVNVETTSYNESEKVLDFIRFRNRSYDHTLDFRTVFTKDFFANYPFTINYNVKVPKHIKLSISNTIGDVRIRHIDGELQLTQSYGKLELKDIASDKNHALNLSFVEGAIDSIGAVKADFSNCTLNMSNGQSLKGKTNYCMASFVNIKNLNINSFTDRLTISNSDSLTLKGSHFIGKIDQLNTYGFCELERGQLLVDAAETIKELTISNKRVKTTVTIPHGVSYLLNGEVFNGTFTHPTPQLLQLFKEGDTVSFSGQLGHKTETPANLILFNKNASITIKN